MAKAPSRICWICGGSGPDPSTTGVSLSPCSLTPWLPEAAAGARVISWVWSPTSTVGCSGLMHWKTTLSGDGPVSLPDDVFDPR